MSREIRISKTLSFWLRHDPAAGGLELDREGWVAVDAVLAALGRAMRPAVTREELEAVVAASDKQRFRIDGDRIRASQGHSVEVEIDFRPVEPPATLYHGTTRERWDTIRRSGGLEKMRRHHVHLSGDEETARRVAGRHRREASLILSVDAAAMRRAGFEFFISDNGVYLVDSVPAEFLTCGEIPDA